jgi:integrase
MPRVSRYFDAIINGTVRQAPSWLRFSATGRLRASPVIARTAIGLQIQSHPTSNFAIFPATSDRHGGACRHYPDRRNVVRLRALILLLRYSGLRIRDAVTLSRDRIRDGKLFLLTAKTGTAVWCPLPECVIEALKAIPGERIFFGQVFPIPKVACLPWNYC